MNVSLNQMLEEGVRYSPLYQPVNNSDHLPMTLCAMHGLGANHSQLTAFRAEYLKKLDTFEPAAAVDDWHEGLGQRNRYPALLQYFLERELSRELIDEVLRLILSFRFGRMQAREKFFMRIWQ